MIIIVNAITAIGVAVIGTALYMYFRPPTITPIGEDSLKHYVRREGQQGDLP